MAAVDSALPDTAEAGHTAFRPGRTGVIVRAVAALLIAAAVLIQPLLWDNVRDHWIGLAAIYAIIGLSVNVITGHAGQISLGHQAFVGIGAFMATFVTAKMGGYFPEGTNLVLPPTAIPTTNFWFGIASAAVIGAIMALALGLVALRIRGLYLALITLAFGLMAENTIFNWRSFTAGGAGLQAPRPVMFQSEQAFVYLVLGFVALFLLLDWRLTKTRAGRAIVALRNDERVASTLGVNVTRFKLLAFATGGLMAGVAGALFAHWNQAVQAQDFVLQTALIWVLMSVVGGLGSRAGVVIGSAFFALFPLVVSDRAEGASIPIPFLGDVLVEILTPFLGALLLLLTITLYPGGIGQQILPLRRWLAGGLLVETRHDLRLAGLPTLVVFLALLLAGTTWYLALAFGVAAGVLTAVLLVLYLRRAHRAVEAQRRSPERGPRDEVQVTAVQVSGDTDVVAVGSASTSSAASSEQDDTLTASPPAPSDESAGADEPAGAGADVPAGAAAASGSGAPAGRTPRTSRFAALRRKRNG